MLSGSSRYTSRWASQAENAGSIPVGRSRQNSIAGQCAAPVAARHSGSGTWRHFPDAAPASLHVEWVGTGHAVHAATHFEGDQDGRD